MSIIIGTFNGTSVNFPYHIQPEKLFDILNEMIEELGEHHTLEEAYEQLVEIDNLICANSVNGVVTQYVIEKVCKILEQDAETFVFTFYSCIYYLLQNNFYH